MLAYGPEPACRWPILISEGASAASTGRASASGRNATRPSRARRSMGVSLRSSGVRYGAQLARARCLVKYGRVPARNRRAWVRVPFSAGEPAARAGHPMMRHRSLSSGLLKPLQRRLGGSSLPLRLVFWNGTALAFAPDPTVTITLRSPRVLRMLLTGNMGRLGQAYVEGEIRV